MNMFLHKRTNPQLRKNRVLLVKLFPQDKHIKFGWKALCTLWCTIALILECINVTLNERCNHQNNQTTVSLLKTIPKVLPMHSKTDIPKALAH